ncbi:MAG: extracellular solute-binding protein [Eubacteriales bacterium]|nr:extracellular solute-binding protein [Eubacteriales bacterium]
MSVRKKLRRISVFMFAGMLFLGGCQRTVPAKEDGTHKERAMGRYVEEQIPLEMDTGECETFVRLEDGRLALFSAVYGPMVSEDEGKTWTPWQSEWFWSNQPDSWLKCAAIAPDGMILAGYSISADETEEEAGEEETVEETVYETDEEETLEETDEEETVEEAVEETNEEAEDLAGRKIVYQAVFPDGSSRYVEFEEDIETQDDTTAGTFWFAPDGSLYMARSHALYEISMEETQERDAALRWKLTRIWEGEASIDQVCFAGEDLIAVNYQGAYIYDRSARQWKQKDETLDAFLRDKAAAGGNLLRYARDGYNVYLCGNPDGTLWLVCDEGIYAHRSGGGTIEKIVDGTLCMLGDPSANLYGMLASDDNTFLVLYQSMLGEFAYHADIPAVPDRELYVYSLEKDDVVQKAASLFTKEHPEVYVRYEIGMSENSGQTQEDVLKNLNTEILAGKGPDVLILDGFDLDAYMEKGLLADLGDVLEEAKKEEEFYDNIADAFRQDGKLCAIPMRFCFPVVIGPAEELKKAENLDDFAGCVESLRQKKESGSVMGGVEPYATLELLALGCAASWKTPDGQMDEEAVEEFLVQAERIYRAEAQGISQEEREEFEGTHFGTNDKRGVVRERAYMQVTMSTLNVILHENRIGIGNAEGIDDMRTLLSAQKQENGLFCGLFGGQSQNVFFPYTIAGVSSLSREEELAKQFVATMLSEQAADSGSFSVNKKAVRNAVNIDNVPYEELIGMVGGYDGNESFVGMDICQFSKEGEAWFYRTLDSLRTPYLPGDILEETVLSYGEKVLCGEMGVSEACQEIEKKAKLVMAERQ